MPALSGFVNFNPDKEIPSLLGKVIFITGGTAGLGKASIEALAKHDPAHIYFTGRNEAAADALITSLKTASPNSSLTFIRMDLSSLASVKSAAAKFVHDRLDILICNAGIMEVPPALSTDGFEIHMATNHLGHAMLIRQLLPIMLRTAETPGADVRLVSLTSIGWKVRPSIGICYDKVRTKQDGIMTSWARYGQSKLANLVYAAELARRHPQILSVSVHPGVVTTDLVNKLHPGKKALTYTVTWLQGISLIPPEKGCLNELWVATAERSNIVNGAYYIPVGVMSNNKLDSVAKSEKFASELWRWTNEVLDGF